MKKFKRCLKKFVIIYVIFYIVLGSITSCFARSYDTACGEYLAQYARDFIATYGENSVYGGRTGRDSGDLTTSATAYPGWSDGTLSSPGGTLYSACTSGVWYMYLMALGIDIYQYGYSASASGNLSLATTHGEYWEEIPLAEAMPGDIAVRSDHVELVIAAGNAEHANFGGSDPTVKVSTYNLGNYTAAFRLRSTVDVTPNGTVPSSSSRSSVNLSEFYFNGIPDGKYSLAYTNIWTKIIETLAQIADYLIGLLTYIIRIPFIGWTAIVDNLLNWTVNTVTDTGVTEEDMGINSVEVEGADDDTRLTTDGLIYNDYPLTDINIFR